MENKTIAEKKSHCLVLIYPAQGHVNPMIQFSKLLVHQGVKVTLCTTRYYIQNFQKVPPSMSLETISDGFDNGRDENIGNQDYLARFWEVGPTTLTELIEKLSKTEYPVDCIIYDSFLIWALDVVKKLGIVGAVYLTQNLAVNSIYYHAQVGKIRVPITEDEIVLPAMPKLRIGELPSFFVTYGEDPASFGMVVGQFSNIQKADWILCNAFYELDKEIADWTINTWPKFRTIGPNIPSMFLDKRFKDDQDYGVSQFKSDEYCIEWLDNKPKGSVIYISFGSLAAFDEEQMGEIACALRDSNNYFLWVVRASELTKLPKDFGKESEKGLIVTWCSQLKVLAHESIGCFVTHCGWNSTLETLSLGVATIGVPFWSDQQTNAKYMEDVWKVGIRAPVDEKNIVRREAFKNCLKEMMEGEKGKEMKRNAIQLKNLAIRAVSDGGSSHQNIVEFVSSLFSLQAACPEL